jgi:MoxR-like ATPase
MSQPSPDDVAAQAEQFRTSFTRLQGELGRVMVGQQEVLESVLVAFFAAGHVLLEGVPGLGKTSLVRTLSEAVDLEFSRIQFTPDLMPADIIGTDLIVEDEEGKRRFQFQPGPVFANILLADEINRATPKTQSALLEAMQEKHVTVGGKSHKVGQPFLVLATQNPLEMEGTYPLPEAQLDRFFFKVRVPYPSAEELHTIIERTTQRTSPEATKVLGKEEILRLRDIARDIPLARDVQDEAVRIVLHTHPEQAPEGSLARKYARYGASPRGLQAIILAAKIYALLAKRFHVAREDIHKATLPALRHRVILNFDAEADNITPDDVLREVIKLGAKA